MLGPRDLRAGLALVGIPLVDSGTGSCPARHSGYMQSGLAAPRNDDGYEADLGPRTSEGGDPDGGQVAHGQLVQADGDSTVALSRLMPHSTAWRCM